ncbi:MAG TPA: DUF2510 domain-containing protein, partial [Mycobacterium sp.]|nr:DUF2510 domain-containing protein [Mycobacterium sp.]
MDPFAAPTRASQPGWYADPRDPDLVRWWDGYQWTPATKPATAVTPYSAAPPGWPHTPVPPHSARRRAWLWVGIGVGVASLVALIVILAARDSGGSGDARFL